MSWWPIIIWWPIPWGCPGISPIIIAGFICPIIAIGGDPGIISGEPGDAPIIPPIPCAYEVEPSGAIIAIIPPCRGAGRGRRVRRGWTGGKVAKRGARRGDVEGGRRGEAGGTCCG